MAYSDSCLMCGRWRECNSPKISADVPKDEKKLDILFVGDYPEAEDDVTGNLFSGDAGGYLRSFAEMFKGLKIGFTSVVKCYVPNSVRKDEKLLKHIIGHCNEHLQADLWEYDPKYIVCLGSTALKAVNPEGPKTVAQARVTPSKLGSSWVLTTFHPSNKLSGRMPDIDQHYFSLGKLMSKIESGEYQKSPDIRAAEDEDLPLVASQMASSKRLYFDVETDTWDDKARPDLKTFYMPGRKMICIGIATDGSTPVWVLRPSQFEKVKHLFKGKTLVAHNILYDASVLHYLCGMDWVWDECDLQDTFLMHVSLDQGSVGNGLSALAMKYLSVPSWKEEVFGFMKHETEIRRRDKTRPYPGPATFADLPMDMLVAYNGRDVYYTKELYRIFSGFDLPQSYENRYLRLLPLLGKVQITGIGADKQRILATSKAYRDKIDFLVRSLNRAPEIREINRIHEQQVFNVRSPQQKTELLGLLGIDTGFSDSGKYFKTDKRTLKIVGERNTLVRRVSAITEMQNMLSKFLDPLVYHIADDGRIHTTYKMGKSEESLAIGGDPTGGVTTGRLAASDPPIHNLKKDYFLRSCFVPSPGWVSVEFDYGAAEVRGLAWLANCQNLLKWFNEDIDPYIMVMAVNDRVLYPEMWKEYKNGDATLRRALKDRRQSTKGGFLGWQYGSGIQKFAETIGTTISDAERLYDLFTRLFPEVRAYQENELGIVRSGMPIVTPWGVQRYFALENPHDENMVKNFKIQSTMSDMTLFAALEVMATIPKSALRIVNLVHDAIWCEIREDVLIETANKVARIMRRPSNLPFDLTVRLEVEAKFGPNLGSMKELVLS